MSRFNFVSREPIDKGWSGDKKYRVIDADGRAYLLRVSPHEQLERKRLEFNLMRECERLGIPMCEPLELFTSDEGVCTVLTFIDGSDAELVIPTLSPEAQYSYGIDAGRILRELHKIPAPDGPDWAVYFNRKLDRKLAMYEKCPLKYAHGECFVDYIATHRGLLANRPRSFQHGDYHIGNMMLSAGKLYVIDFNRLDFGDPWEEFNRIVWCAQASPRFASGMVDGYFDGEIPREFWELLALYISSNTLSSLPWAVDFGEREIAVMTAQAREVLDWYDGMRNPIPGWYNKT